MAAWLPLARSELLPLYVCMKDETDGIRRDVDIADLVRRGRLRVEWRAIEDSEGCVEGGAVCKHSRM